MVQWQTYAKSGLIGKQFGPKDSSARRPRDEEINAHKVYLVRPEDSRLTEALLLSEVLAARERDEKGRPTQFVQEVSPPTEEIAYPVCKIYDKKAAREAEEAKRKASKITKMKWQTKQLELGWSVSDNDLGYRLARLKEFLQKGWRVEMVFGSKRKSGWNEKREASLEEANKVLGKIRKTVGEVEGAQERQMQGEVGKEAILFFEGKAKK
ncbi:hypothetical protein IMSHALPRED_006561 [Imshaugia aleurites]|uniref:Translation initiation factor 3 N-terminal domain-containing protein n=1 Tax=Imshaugia aleurites TaxID=172621 RepID=A0A8H3EPV5_9LECA|nr:hypothetical protein IMSHALPRED_006561 [Imshaugia aleurites]